MNIKNSADLNIDNMFWTILIYGLSKTWKSRFVCTFPNVLVFDFDNGMKSCIEFGVDYITYGSDPSEWNRFESDVEELRQSPSKYKTIVFDSGTSMADLLLRKLMDESKRDTPTKFEYGQRVKILNDIISAFTKIGKNFNFILVCHEDTLSDEEGRLLHVHPYLPGRYNAANQFDEVYHTSIARITNDGTPVPIIRSSPSRPYIRGSRINIGDLEQPTYTCFIKHAEEALNKLKQIQLKQKEEVKK